jgi:hypothetical protein
MTAAELIAILQTYPDNTPIVIGKESELHARSITEVKLDDWEHSTVTEDNYEIPAVIVGVHIGPRF